MNVQKVALITGGMGGLGESICRKMFKAGYRVVATCSPSNDQSDDWLAAQKKEGFEFSACRIDVADHASCEAGVMDVVGATGRVDVLVNNAGITADAALKKMTR